MLTLDNKKDFVANETIRFFRERVTEFSRPSSFFYSVGISTSALRTPEERCADVESCESQKKSL
jgi:hypothetical protein